MTVYRKDQFLEVLLNRYACKKFDQAKPLSDSDCSYILECARLSPSSFGLEHWELYAVRSELMIHRFYSACFEQEAVSTASLVVVSVFRTKEYYLPDSPFIYERGSRFPGGIDTFVADYQGYYSWLQENDLVEHWARSQCYIPCANMMTGAAAVGIDSCAIEGFDNHKVLDALSLDASGWQTGIITVFGHGFDDVDRQKIRMSTKDIIHYV